jgi:hypothetical protein
MRSLDHEDPAYITDESLIKIGLTREIWEKWYDVIDSIYLIGLSLYPDNLSVENNIIYVGDWKIEAIPEEPDRVRVKVHNNDVEHLSMIYTGNQDHLTETVYTIIGGWDQGKEPQPQSYEI